MSSLLDINRIDIIQPLAGFPPLMMNVPANYPYHPDPNRLTLLWNSNNENIYHKFSPYIDTLRDSQPFVWRYPDQNGLSLFNELPETAVVLANDIQNPTNDKIDDLIRVSKFIDSPAGSIFVEKQRMLQKLQSFNETRTYNPSSIILAATAPMSLGEHPNRHIEGNFNDAFTSTTSTSTINIPAGGPSQPPGTSPDALPTVNLNQGKGLIRGNTAESGYVKLTNAWAVNASTSDKTPTISSLIRAAASSLIDSTTNQFSDAYINPKSIGKYRADEDTYTLMINSYKLKKSTEMGLYSETSYIPQMWYAGKPNGVEFRSKMFRQSLGFKYEGANEGVKSQPIKRRDTGYTLTPTSVYTDGIKLVDDGELTNSDVLVQFATYYKDNFPSKLDNVDSINQALKSAMTSINNKSSYHASVQVYSYLMSNGKEIGYTDTFNKVPKDLSPSTPKNSYGVGYNYYFDGPGLKAPKTIDKTMSPNHLHMATSFTSDALNKIGILKGGGNLVVDLSTGEKDLPSWKPYNDDLIAFYFYDVVNDKFVPFRATVKSISESGNAFWDDLRFIGRADQVYIYNGFNRTLSFTFNIVVNSITELLPTWKKINYLKGMIKPSNYTKKGNQPFNRFIVPPMFMITIGDLYRFQPIVINSIDVNVPDDASWETLNEINSEQWSYLNGMITSPSLGKNYAQLPKEVEISINGNLLEKERAIVGGTNFGHAPFNDSYLNEDDRLSGGKVYLPPITKFHKDMTEYQDGSDSITGTPRELRSNNQLQSPSQNEGTTILNSSNNEGSSQTNVDPLSIPTTTGANVAKPIVEKGANAVLI
jgi:hypothetical protein